MGSRERFTIGDPPALIVNPNGEAQVEAFEIEVAGLLRHFALFGLDEDADRSPERVFDARLQRQHVRHAGDPTACAHSFGLLKPRGPADDTPRYRGISCRRSTVQRSNDDRVSPLVRNCCAASR